MIFQRKSQRMRIAQQKPPRRYPQDQQLQSHSSNSSVSIVDHLHLSRSHQDRPHHQQSHPRLLRKQLSGPLQTKRVAKAKQGRTAMDFFPTFSSPMALNRELLLQVGSPQQKEASPQQRTKVILFPTLQIMQRNWSLSERKRLLGIYMEDRKETLIIAALWVHKQFREGRFVLSLIH